MWTSDSSGREPALSPVPAVEPSRAPAVFQAVASFPSLTVACSPGPLPRACRPPFPVARQA